MGQDDERTPFQEAYAAIESGDADEFRTLLDRHPGLIEGEGAELMGSGAEFDRPEILSILADRGIALDSIEAGASPLGKAAEAGSLEAAAWLLDRGVDIESATDRHGSSALHEAIAAGQLAMVQFLLDRGADPDRLHGNPRRNALSCALLFQEDEIADHLRERGVREIVVGSEPIDVESSEFMADDGRGTMSWYEGKWHHVYDAATRRGLGSLGVKNQAFFLVGYLIQELSGNGAVGLLINPSGPYTPLMVDALDAIGDAETADLLGAILALFPAGRPSGDDIPTRAAEVEALPPEFAALGERLERRLDDWDEEGVPKVLVRLDRFYHDT